MIEDVKSLYSGLRGGAVSLSTGGPAVEPMMMAAVFGLARSQPTVWTNSLRSPARRRRTAHARVIPAAVQIAVVVHAAAAPRHAAAVRRAAAAAAAVVAVAGVEDHDHA